MAGIFFALTAALFWGSGDFSGGFASRKRSPFQVVVLSALSGVAVLLIAAGIWKESFPDLRGIAWSAAAGATGAVGISALYSALARGNSAVVAPTSAVVGASLPVLFTLITSGAPARLQIIGFALAILGIWLVSASVSTPQGKSKRDFALACLAGTSFGAFFIFIAQVGEAKVFTPLVLARVVMFLAALMMLRANHLAFPKIKQSGIAVLAGTLDAVGNVFFLLAKQFARLDTAVIISSLYPAETVILTGLLLKEKISRRQKLGVGLCLAAIVLISL